MPQNIPPPTIEQSCMEALHWGWDIPESVPLSQLRLALRQRGFRDISKFDWVWELEDKDQHRVLIVPRTRRLQIRIHYILPKPKRPVAAWSIALLLHQACVAINVQEVS